MTYTYETPSSVKINQLLTNSLEDCKIGCQVLLGSDEFYNGEKLNILELAMMENNEQVDILCEMIGQMHEKRAFDKAETYIEDSKELVAMNEEIMAIFRSIASHC